jgi:sporulation protein YlmC with PRC-barrel domain
VRGSDSVMAAGTTPDIKAILERDDRLVGTRVFTEVGDDEGKVSDVYFDDASGRLVGLEVSGGLLADAARGARYLAIDDVVRFGRDVLYVHPEVSDQLEGQRGGVAGALGDVTQKVRETGEAAIAAGQNGGADPGSAAGPEDSLVGKRTGVDVEDDTGAVLVPAGRRITAADVEQARAAGKLPALTASAGMGEAAQAADGAKDALADIGDRAASVWDAFTRKLGETTDATGRRVDEEQAKRRLGQIEDAVGRPVTKVFLDLEDRVILDLGDLITHAAIQRAHEAGSLDSLLSSVYKGEVTFDKAEMRAERPAEAALEQASTPGISAPIVDELRTKLDEAERERAEAAEAEKAKAEADRDRRSKERASRRREREAEKAASPDAQEAPAATA